MSHMTPNVLTAQTLSKASTARETDTSDLASLYGNGNVKRQTRNIVKEPAQRFTLRWM